MSKGNPFLALRLSPVVIDTLREISTRQGRSVSDVAREALARGLPFERTAVGASPQEVDGPRTRPRTRRLSRLQRATRATDELRELLAEYTDWQERIPAFAEANPTAEKLQEAVEVLETAIDALDRLDLPKGYGRD